MNKNITRYCTKCILPDTYPGISFNSEGECSYCSEYSPVHANLGKEALLNVLKSQKKTGQYDCVVPLSGGNCEAILRTAAINTARADGAPFVFWGSSALESWNYSSYVNIGKRQEKKVATHIAKALSKLRALAIDPRKAKYIPKIIYSHIGYHAIMFKMACIFQRLKLDFPYRYALKPHYVPPFTDKNPAFIHFFEYISWDSINNVEVLENELKWRHPEGRDSRFDCLVHCISNREHLVLHGITQDGATYCNFIREGKMDRATALKSEETTAASIDGEVRELLDRVGLKGYSLEP